MRSALVKVNVVEEPALKRVLEIEIPAEEVDGGLREVVEEYRRNVVLPGFRKGKAPLDMVRAQMADNLENEYLRKALPKAYFEALKESGLEPAGEPEIKDLQFRKGEPLKFSAHIEVWPKFELTGHEGLQLVREEQEVADADIEAELDTFRQSQATWPGVDRPAQGGDRVALDYWVLDAAGERGEQQTGVIEVGGSGTPEAFNQALMGVSKGESRRVVLPAVSHTTEEGVHEHPEQTFDILVTEVRERTLPALDDAFAKLALGSDNADLESLKARVRLSLESREMMKSRDRLEGALFDELIARNPFELPASIVAAALDDVVGRIVKERGGEALPAEEETQARDYYRPAVERRIKSDLIIGAAGRMLNVQILDEDVDNEINRYAEREQATPAEVRGKLKKTGGLDRLKDDMYRHKVIETLLGQARVDVVKKGR
jgi:trigger factor